MKMFRAAALFVLTACLFPASEKLAHAQALFPAYEIIDVRILTYLPDRGWVSNEHTSGFIAANKKDFSVSIGRNWIGVENGRFIQGPLNLSDLLVLLGVPTEGYDPTTFPFIPELAGPYIPTDINAEGDFSARRWYAQDADAEKGSFLLPVGASLVELDLFQLEGAPKQDGVAWWARLILYESKEGIIEVEPSQDEEGLEFTEDDVRDPSADDDGLEFTEEDLRDLSNEDEGLEFTEDDVREPGTDEDGLEFTEEDVFDPSADDDGLVFTEEDLEELSNDDEGLEFTEEDVRELAGDEEGLEFTDEEVLDANNEGLEFTQEDVLEPWQREMTDAQRRQAELYRDQLTICAETGAGCPEGVDADAVQVEYETNPDGFADLARDMAEDSVLGVERDDDGWPRAMPDNEAQQAQQDYEQIKACVLGPTACPDYIHKETAKLFFENADPKAADDTIREIIVNEVGARTAQSYEVEVQ